MTRSELTKVIIDLLRGNCDVTSLPIFQNEEMLEGRMTKGVTVLLLIMAIMTVAMNFGVILRIYKLIRKGGDVKPAFFFIGNLAISDFFVGTYVIVMFCIDLSKTSSNWRNKCCGFLTATVVTACQETICSITLIAVDKYVFICHGLTYRSKVTKKRVYLSILITWCYSLMIGLLPSFGLHETYWCSCSFLLYVSKGFAIILFLSAVVIPLAIIVTLYSIILSLAVKVTRSRMRDRRSTSSGISTSVVRLSISNSSNSSRSNSKASNMSRSSSTESAKERRFRKREVVDSKKQEALEKKEKDPLRKKKSNSLSIVNESFENKEEQISITPNGLKEDLQSSGTDSTDSNAELKKARKNRNSYDLATSIEQIDSTSQVSLKSYKNLPEGLDTRPAIRIHKSVKINEHAQIHRAESLNSNNNYSSSQESVDSSSSKQRHWTRKSYYKKIVTETKDKVQFLKKCKAIKIIVMIVSLFIFTYVPFVIGTFVFKIKSEPNERLFKALNNLLYCAVVLNSLINPFIYAYGYQEFRIKTKNFKGIFAKEKRNSISDIR